MALRRAQEARVMRERQNEFGRADLQRHYGVQRSMEAASKFVESAQDRAEQRQLQVAILEAERRAAVIQAQREQEWVAAQREEEQSVEAALKRRAAEQQRTAREVQRLQEESEELRALQSHINAATVRMGQKLQLQERADSVAAARRQDIELDKQLMQHGAEEAAQRQQVDEGRRAAAVKARQDLEEQLRGNARLRELAQLEYRKEREAVDAIMRNIDEEDAMEAAHRAAKRAETQAFIAAFLAQQQQIRAEAAAEAARQEAAIEEYAAAKREQEGQHEARRAANRDVADRLLIHLQNLRAAQGGKGAQLAAEEEEERLVNLMRAEEEEERARQEAAARAARAERLRQEMVAANAAQLRLKAERLEAHKAAEAEERLQLLARLSEEDRIDQMTAQRKRMRIAEHRREVEALLQAKCAAFQQEQAKEHERGQAWRAEEAHRAAVIAAERERLLRGAAHLRAYLPRRDAQDIDRLVAVRD